MKAQSSAGFLIAKIHQAGNRIFSKLLKDNGIEINPPQGRIMFALWQKNNQSINELAKATSLSKSTMTPMLDRLEEMGYLKRVPSKKDRRIITIESTDKDKELTEKYTLVSNEMLKIFYENFFPQDINQFEEYLTRLYKNLERYESIHFLSDDQ